MIYILTGIAIFVVAYRYKRHLPKTLRIIGFIYLAMSILEGISGRSFMSLLFGGFGMYDVFVYLGLGIIFIVVGTKDIRMPPDDIVEDDILEEHNPSAL